MKWPNGASLLSMQTIPALESLRSAPLGIYIIDSNWVFIFANQKAITVFEGFGITNLVGQNFQDVMFSLRAHSAAEQIIAKFRRTMETGEPFAVSNFGLGAESLSGL